MNRTGKECLSAAQLKLLAIVSMLIDHIAAALWPSLSLMIDEAYLVPGQFIYSIMRYIGRLAFPVFVYFLVEGFFCTRSRKKYFLRLLVFAICSEIPFDMAFFGQFVNWSHQNVGWQLLLIFLMLSANEGIRGWCKKRLAEKKQAWVFPLCAAGVAALFMYAATITSVDYQWGGILLAFLFYLFRKKRVKGIVIAAAGFSLYEITGIPGVLLNILYNGERGKQRQKFFYWFYPVHLAILGGIVMFVLKG